MKRNLILLLAAGALGILLLSIITDQSPLPGETSNSSTDSQDRVENPAAEQAQAMVAQAIEYMDEHGTAALIEKVNADAAEFHQGELYVFVLDRVGTIVAHPINPSWVGADDQIFRDADGNAFLARMAKAATDSPDGSWFDYRLVNPVTEEASDKSSWVVMRDNHIIGSGIYSKPE